MARESRDPDNATSKTLLTVQGGERHPINGRQLRTVKVGIASLSRHRAGLSCYLEKRISSGISYGRIGRVHNEPLSEPSEWT